MNQKDDRVRFRKRIDAELSDLNGDPYLADRVLALAQPEKQYSKAKRPAHLKLVMAATALVLLTISVLLWHTQPQNDFVTASSPENQDKAANSVYLSKTSMYCPVCNKHTQWIEDCSDDYEMTDQSGTEKESYVKSCLSCINCGNRYILDKSHLHLVMQNGTEVLVCPYLKTANALLEKYPDIVNTAFADAQALGQQTNTLKPAFRESFCETCGKITQWKETCSEDASLFISHINHSDQLLECDMTIVYAKTMIVCTGCGKVEDTGDTHLHLIKHRDRQASYDSAILPETHRNYTCPYLKDR